MRHDPLLLALLVSLATAPADAAPRRAPPSSGAFPPASAPVPDAGIAPAPAPDPFAPTDGAPGTGEPPAGRPDDRGPKPPTPRGGFGEPGAPPTPDQIPDLVRRLGAAEWKAREEATEALAAAGDAALPALEEAAQSDDAEVRTRAARILDIVRWGITPELRARVGDLLEGFAELDARHRIERLNELQNRAGGALAAPFYARVLRAERDENVLPLAFQLFNAADADAARRTLEAMVRSRAALPWHVECLGRLLTADDKAPAAAALFEDAVSHGIDRPGLRVAWAEALEGAGRAPRAIEVLEAPAPGEDPSHAADAMLARLLFAAGRWDAALDRYTRLARAALADEPVPDDVQSFAAAMGSSLRRLGRGDEAEARWRELFSAAAQGGSGAPWWQLNLAEALRRDGRPDRVEAVIREALQTPDGDDPDMRRAAANLLALSGRYPAALEIYRKLAADDGSPAWPDALERLLRFAGRSQESFDVWEKGRAADPGDLAKTLKAAGSAEANEMYDRAVALYREAIEKHPGPGESDPAPAQLAALLARLGRHEEALAVGGLPAAVHLRSLLALGRLDAAAEFAAANEGELNDPEGWTLRGRLLRLRGRPADGVALLAEYAGTLSDDGGSFDARVELGRLHEAAGDPAAALVDCVLATRFSDLRLMDVQDLLRRARYLAARPGVARQALAALRARPDFATGVSGADGGEPAAAAGSPLLPVEGELLALAGDAAKAAEAYERADATAPRDAGALCRAAEFRARAGQADKARNLLDRAAKEWPDDPRPWLGLERLARAAGRAGEADWLRVRAAKTAELDKTAAFRAGAWCMACGELEWAAGEFRKVLAAPGESFHEDTNAREYLAHLLAREGRWAAAADAFRQVLREREVQRWLREEQTLTVEEGGTPYAAMIHLGDAREAERLGKTAGAAPAYERALACAPDCLDAREALARLALTCPERSRGSESRPSSGRVEGAGADAETRSKHRAAAVKGRRDRILESPLDPEPRYRLAKFLFECATAEDTEDSKIPGFQNSKQLREEAGRLAREAVERLPDEARYRELVRRLGE